jgi:hypothetical protein
LEEIEVNSIFNYYKIIIIWALLLIFAPAYNCCEAAINPKVQIPYGTEKQADAIYAKNNFLIRVIIDGTVEEDQELECKISATDNLLINQNANDWSDISDNDKKKIAKKFKFVKGYNANFDVLSILPNASGEAEITINIGSIEKTYKINILKETDQTQGNGISIDKVVFPVDENGLPKINIDDNTILLRDKKIDYLSDLMLGKGSKSQVEKRLHPITYAKIYVNNSSAEQKMLHLRINLLDYASFQKKTGLFTPQQDGDSITGVSENGSEYIKILSGIRYEQIIVPIYADEETLRAGKYWLGFYKVNDDQDELLYKSEVVIEKNSIVSLILLLVFVFVTLSVALIKVKGVKSILEQLKIKQLVMIALFGTTMFACVSIPASFLGDILHIVMGPFSFLITGLFSSLFFYMLLISLLCIIPKTGTITLLLLVKLLLGIIMFGHISIMIAINFLVQVIVLEIAVYYFIKQNVWNKVKNNHSMAFIFGISLCFADASAMFVNLQCTKVLYRIFYADWYIFLLVIVNGFIYTFVGVQCGIKLGRHLLRVEGD